MFYQKILILYNRLTFFKKSFEKVCVWGKLVILIYVETKIE